MRPLDSLLTTLLGGATGAAAVFITPWALLLVPAGIIVVALAVTVVVVLHGPGEQRRP